MWWCLLVSPGLGKKEIGSWSLLHTLLWTEQFLSLQSLCPLPAPGRASSFRISNGTIHLCSWDQASKTARNNLSNFSRIRCVSWVSPKKMFLPGDCFRSLRMRKTVKSPSEQTGIEKEPFNPFPWISPPCFWSTDVTDKSYRNGCVPGPGPRLCRGAPTLKPSANECTNGGRKFQEDEVTFP